jgi:hypothetical protein
MLPASNCLPNGLILMAELLPQGKLKGKDSMGWNGRPLWTILELLAR